MVGFSLNPSPPMPLWNDVIGKFGRFLQVVADDSRSMTSQVSTEACPPQMSSLEKPLNKGKIHIMFGYILFDYVYLGKFRLN